MILPVYHGNSPDYPKGAILDEEEDLYEGGKWEENFTALANRRYKVVD